MSRTDKDAPWWVQSEFYEPAHGRHCVEERSMWRRWPLRPCNLPPEPMRKSPKYYTWRSLDCHWEPVWPRTTRRFRYRVTWAPRAWDRRLQWWSPDRADVCDALREAMKEYHGDGVVDVIPPQYSPRHHPKNGWWD